MADLPLGVPNLLDQTIAFLDPANLLTSDTFFGYGLGAPQWGIFLDGEAVVAADTVTTFSFHQDWVVADYPIESGGFESYDKVNTPYRAEIQFVAGGSITKREALLASIASIGDTLTLYDVVTPEAVYQGVNVEHYNYRRSSSNGLGLMIVNVGVLEIREDNTTNNFQNPADPSGFKAAPAGNVQAQPVPNNQVPGTGTITIKPVVE